MPVIDSYPNATPGATAEFVYQENGATKNATPQQIQSALPDFGTLTGRVDTAETNIAAKTSNVATLAALQLIDGTSGQIVYLAGRTSAGDGGEGHFQWVTGDQSANVTADTLSGIWVAGTDGTGAGGAWNRQYSDFVHADWFGAVGDATTNDTTAVQAALTFAATNKKGLEFDGRTYIVNGLSYTFTDLRTFHIRGRGKEATKLRSNSGVDPIITLTSDPGILETYTNISGMTIDGVDKTRDGVKLNNCARFEMDDVRIRNCSKGIHSLGSLVYVVKGSTINNNLTGFYARQLNSIYANLIKIQNSQITGNTARGIDFDYGNMLILDSVDIELNGTTADTTTGGVFIGANTGTEISLNTAIIRIVSTWFESNKGMALDVDSGHLICNDLMFLNNENVANVATSARVSLTNVVAPSTGDTFTISGTDKIVAINCLVTNGISTSNRVIGINAVNSGEDGFTHDVEISNAKGIDLSWAAGTAKHQIINDSGNGRLKIVPYNNNPLDLQGDLWLKDGGTWNTTRLRLGVYYLWVDATGDLRIKNGAPASDTDGTIVGTQS